MTPEQTLPGGFLVYPGHPVSLAFIVMQVYPDLESALARDGRSPWPAALGNQAIPGGGGEVHAALDLLLAVRNGHAPSEAVAAATARWHAGQAGGHIKAVAPGQAQADQLLDRFYALLEQWLPEQDRALPPDVLRQPFPRSVRP